MRRAKVLAASVGLAILLALFWFMPAQRSVLVPFAPVEISPPTAAARPRAGSTPAPLASRREAVAPTETKLSAPMAPQAAAGLSSLRAPVIEAIRAPGLAPEQKREAMVRAIEASGHSDEAWTAEAAAAFDAWRRGMPEGTRAGLQLGSVNCFRAGCVSEVRFRDEATSRAAAAAFRGLTSDPAQHGGRVQTPVSTRVGKPSAHWIMLRPETSRDGEEDDV